MQLRHVAVRHPCRSASCGAPAAARTVVRRERALELLESVHRPRMRAGLEVVPPRAGPGVMALRRARNTTSGAPKKATGLCELR